MNRKIEISYKTVFFIAGFLALLWVLFTIRELIFIVFAAIIIMSALSPLVDRIVKFNLPKGLAIGLIYALVMLALISLVTLGVTPITTQTSDLIAKISTTLNAISQTYHIDTSTVQSQLPNISNNILSFTIDILNGFITAILVVVISIYLLIDKSRIEATFPLFFGKKENRVRHLIQRIERRLGAWLRGQLFLSLIVGVFTYAGLKLLGVDFALPLALIAGLFEIIPFFGPILAAIPGILIALTVSPLLAAMTLLMYILVQQLESHVLIPQVMKKAVGLNPLVVIIAIAIGNKLLGVAGALLAVPTAVVCHVIAEDYIRGFQEDTKVDEEMEEVAVPSWAVKFPSSIRYGVSALFAKNNEDLKKVSKKPVKIRT